MRIIREKAETAVGRAPSRAQRKYPPVPERAIGRVTKPETPGQAQLQIRMRQSPSHSFKERPMKNCVALPAASILLAFPAFAQRNEPQREEKHGEREHGPNAPRANQGRIPAPPQHREPHAAPERQALSPGSPVRARPLRALRPLLPVQSRTLRSRSTPLLVPRRLLLSNRLLGFGCCRGLGLR